MTFNPDPDVIISHRPIQCSHCQATLSAELAASDIGKRQILDLPPLRFVPLLWGNDDQRISDRCDQPGAIRFTSQATDSLPAP